MILHKVRTTRKTGNYVRYFLATLILAAFVASCQKIDTGSDDPRDNLLGTWNCKETSQSFGVTNFTIEISKSTTDTTKILIDNFYQLGNSFSVYAKINGMNLTIPSQSVDGNQISGSGTISSNYNTINWTYNVLTGTTTDHVTAVYTK
jgi:hypothetical protein